MNTCHEDASACQFCHQPVQFTQRPADAGYAAFAHVATGTIACPKADA